VRALRYQDGFSGEGAFEGWVWRIRMLRAKRVDQALAGYRSPVRILEPGRKRRGKPTAFWLWSLVGVLAVLVVLGLALR
jgi:hypothetical protein